jgi:septal ring factor EnvC (AmiA/AmiB activator)
VTVPDSSHATTHATTGDLENLDKHLTEAVERMKQELLSELHTTKLEVAQLRKELRQIQEQAPPKIRAL